MTSRDRAAAIVGPGRIGLSLAADLAAAGVRVRVLGRDPEPPPDLVLPDGAGWTRDPAEALALPLLLVAVPDDSLSEAGRRLAAAADERPAKRPRGDDGGRARPGGAAPDTGSPVALHTSGAHSAETLAPLRGAGFALGSWHPLAAVAAPGPGRFRGVTVGVEGDPAAVEGGRALAERVGALPLPVPSAAKVRYHAAAVFASNFLVACLSAAEAELREATGETPPPRALTGLARSALAAVEERGLREGLTGPLARGDRGTVAAHVAALDPDRASLYRALGRELLRLTGDRLPPEARRELERILAPTTADEGAGG